MAGTGRSWVRWIVLAALACGSGARFFAQQAEAPAPAASGALSGRLTDLHSDPIGGITVILRNPQTGAEIRTTTAKNGFYRFRKLAPGAYTLLAVSARLGQGQLDGIMIASGHESRVQAAIAFLPSAPPPAAPALLALPGIAHPEIQPSAPGTPAIAHFEARPMLQPLIPRRVPRPQPAPAPRPQAPVLLSRRPPPPSPTIRPPEQAASVSPPPATAALAASVTHSSGLRPDGAGMLLAQAAVTSALALTQAAARQTEVEQESEQAELAAPAVTTTLSAAQIEALPATGRRWQELFLDTPAASGSGSAQLALRGDGQDAVDTTIDGASTRLAFGVSAGSAAGAPSQDPSGDAAQQQNTGSRGWSGRGFMVSEAAVREVRVVAGNVEPEGSYAAGGRTDVETESGGNALHGQAFAFDRQNTWGARNPFTQWVRNTGTVTAPNFEAIPFTPPDHEIAWGLGMGSRIRRNKLFWFGALDGYQRNDPAVATPKNAAQIFAPVEPTSAQVVLLSAQLGESANQAYNDYMGIPRDGVAPAGLQQLAGLLGPTERTASRWSGFARLDWQPAERHKFTLEGTGSNWNAPGGGFTRVSETFGSHSFGSSESRQEWLQARWQAFLTENLLAVTQVSAGRSVRSARPQAPSPFEQAFLNSNSYGQLPQIVVDSRYGFTIGNPARFGAGNYPDERFLHAQEMLDWVHGPMLFKAGFELDHNSDASSLLRNRTGTYVYSKVQNFISDALAFQRFGLNNLFNFQNPHNCSANGKSLGALPCYSYFTQTIGPTEWHLSTNDLAGWVTGQWQLTSWAVFSAGLRWEHEQLPPPMSIVDNPELPLTEKLPNLGNQWGPRISLAIGSRRRWPVLRLGYGMYYGRTQNATLMSALTQTGSLQGDLSFFIRPTDGMVPSTQTSAAPPFPYVLNGRPASVITPGAVEYAPDFRNSEVHQALASIEERLPGRVQLTATAMVSLGRRLPVAIDTNFNAAANPGTITYNVIDKTGKGPIKVPRITVPFYALWPAADCPAGALLTVSGQCGRLKTNYQQITEIEARANSTYEAAMIRLDRYGSRGLSLHAHYTYSHAMDWNPNESTLVAGSDVLDPRDFAAEYGTSNLDVRHSASAMVVFEAPWRLHGLAGRLANGWMLSGVGQFRSGRPYSMRTTGAIPKEMDIFGDPAIIGIGPGMNGSGGDNRVYGVGRNTYRYPHTWKADLRIAKKFNLGDMRQLEILAESFNLFNHRNVTAIHTAGYAIESGTANTLPSLNFLTVGTTGTDATTPSFGTPFDINATNFYRERQIQIGARFRF